MLLPGDNDSGLEEAIENQSIQAQAAADIRTAEFKRQEAVREAKNAKSQAEQEAKQLAEEKREEDNKRKSLFPVQYWQEKEKPEILKACDTLIAAVSKGRKTRRKDFGYFFSGGW